MRSVAILALIVTVTIFADLANSQAPEVLWTRYYSGDNNQCALDVINTSEGGIIMAGYQGDYNDGPSSVFVLKTNSEGDSLWSYTYNCGEYSRGHSIRQTEDDGYVVGGWNNRQDEPSFILRLNSDGDSLWARTYDGDYNSLEVKNDNGYILTGSLERGQDPMIYHDLLLLNTDSDGDTIWTKTYVHDEYSMHGKSVKQTADGGFIIAADYSLPVIIWAQPLIMRTDQYGDTLWTRSYESILSVYRTNDIVELPEQEYAFVGYETTPGPYVAGNSYIMKINSMGDTLWAYRHYLRAISRANSVCLTSTNELIFAGPRSYGGNKASYSVKINLNGDTLWAIPQLGTLQEANSVIESNDNGYLIAGRYQWDMCLVKLESDITGINENTDVKPAGISIYDNYPNPFNASTIISYDLPYQSQVTIDVYDILGRKLETLQDGMQQAGNHKTIWNANDLPSGVYFYKLLAGDYTETKKMVLMK